MEKIDEQLKNLLLVGAPTSLHQSVMRKVQSKRLQPVLLTVLCLLVLNFIVIVWRINTKLVEAEFSDMILDFFEISDFSFSFVSTTLGSFLEIVSLELILSALLSLTGIIYIGRKIRVYQFA